jgi:dihydroorotate dehydrogenase
LKNPVGIAAGFDKNAEAIKGLNHLGFGFIEIGSVTPLAQAGNQKPRVFRLTEDEAIINRYGFNSDGHEKVWHRIQQLRASGQFTGVLGVNLGKNKMSEDGVNDYVEGLKLFAPVADYLVINVSSPNTPGLRDMQHRDTLRTLLVRVNEAKRQLETPKPVFLKLAPDLTPSELKDICKTVSRKDSAVDGLIISNTTVDRSVTLNSSNSSEVGGLSGKPLKEKSRRMIEDVYRLTGGKVPIIGVGGVGR